MNRQYVENWVAALRSGKYKQTTGTLRGVMEHNYIGYCCLGVACDIYPDFDWDKLEYVKIDHLPYEEMFLDYGLNNIPNTNTLITINLDSNYRFNTFSELLVYLNDESNYLFDQIADRLIAC